MTATNAAPVVQPKFTARPVPQRAAPVFQLARSGVSLDPLLSSIVTIESDTWYITRE